jgi:hypothetical protein
MNDPLDAALRDLGRSTPFPVDWAGYARELAARLAKAEARRKRRAAWLASGGALGGFLLGAAAVFLLMVNLPRAPGTTPSPGANVARGVVDLQPTAVAAPIPAQGLVDGKPEIGPRVETEEPLRLAWAAPDNPFIRRFRGSGGKMGEIRFYGFSAPGAPPGGMIAAR